MFVCGQIANDTVDCAQRLKESLLGGSAIGKG